MRLVSVLFGGNECYERMARVLAKSAEENSPATPLAIGQSLSEDEELRKLARPKCKSGWIANARKAKHHSSIIDAALDGELLGMIDADAMILADLSDIEQIEFDIAYTVRPAKSTWKINTGVYFVRVNDGTRKFFRGLATTCATMLANHGLHDKWRKENRYGGIHQAAFGLMKEHFAGSLKLVELPCGVWNCVNDCYETAAAPKIVHLMRHSMRSWCMGEGRCKNDNAKKFVERWREYDKRVSR